MIEILKHFVLSDFDAAGEPGTGQNTDLYKVRERVFRNMDNTFTLRLK